MATFMRELSNRHQVGFAYIAILFFVAAISVSLAIVTQDEATAQMREKERDWLFFGQQYQQAIKSYYEKSPDGIKSLPMEVDDLLLDSRFIAPVRHLRKLYQDPITGKGWVLIRDEQGFLIGVYSESTLPVLLRQRVEQLSNTGSPVALHSDVKFIFVVESINVDESSELEDENASESESESVENGSTDGNN